MRNCWCQCPIVLYVFLLLAPSFVQAVEEDKSDLELIAEIMDWVRSNGGWISDKLEVKQIVGSLSGIFAKKDLANGEVVADIPWNVILSHEMGKEEEEEEEEEEEADWCAKIENVRTAVMKDPNIQTPYERYLAKRSASHVPLFWSNTSKDLLMELMEGIHINGFYNDVNEWWTGDCDRPGDEFHFHSMMLLQTRGEGEDVDLLVPFGDLMNHRNGNYTNTEARLERGKYYQIRTIRAVKAGEELQSSYNQCKWCDGLYSNPKDAYTYQVTPQLFEIYGFVESVPQRWVIPEYRLFFDIIHAEDEDEEAEEDDLVEVDFIVPPSWSGLVFLRQRLQFLEEFEEQIEDRTDIPKDELDGILNFHSALVDAYILAMQHSVGEASERVWLLGEDDWFKENQNDFHNDEL